MIRELARRLTALELPLVGLAVTGCLVSDRLLLPTLGLALIFWGLHWLAYGAPRRRTPTDLPIIGLVLLLPITLWITALPDVTRVQVLRLLVGIALYYSITTWATTLPRLQATLGGCVAVGLGLALAAPVLVDWQSFPVTLLPTAVYARQPFLFGDGVNPNVLAGQLALLLPLILALLLAPQRAPMRGVRLGALLLSGPLVVTLVLTESRGGGLAALVGLATMLLISVRYRILLVSGMLFALAGFTLLGGWNGLLADDPLGGIAGRMEIWSRARYMLHDFAFTGIGMGSFLLVVETLYPYTLVPPGRGEHAHNLLLQVGVDLGLAGLGLWLAVLGLCTLAAVRGYRHAAADDAGWWQRAVALGVLGSQVALLTHGMVDAVTWGMVKPAPLVWAVWGLGVAAAAGARTDPPD